MTDIRDFELDDQVLDEDITCCGEPMYTDGTVYECGCGSFVTIGFGQRVDDLKTPQPQPDPK